MKETLLKGCSYSHTPYYIPKFTSQDALHHFKNGGSHLEDIRASKVRISF